MTVKVYSTPTCPYCHQLKDYLKEKNVEFEDIDVSTDEKEAEAMVKKSGQVGVPVLDVDGTIVVGFDKAKVDELIGK